jgi:hypothetical protein
MGGAGMQSAPLLTLRSSATMTYTLVIALSARDAGV